MIITIIPIMIIIGGILMMDTTKTLLQVQPAHKRLLSSS
ncbi:MAG: hypothetical protein Barrevirus15_10 [Barrevirus sp.]|uniref:Uncharacterized protein n=1 Tax=Barrevirus sp. TaxID=2487763 RepID=A0A3G4ZQI5_9VIRU|nr:MAG: hypothetical protein Barrevirus15_10 [Barrevirus sp.]